MNISNTFTNKESLNINNTLIFQFENCCNNKRIQFWVCLFVLMNKLHSLKFIKKFIISLNLKNLVLNHLNFDFKLQN